MSFHRWTSLIQRSCLVGCAVVLAAGLASAQSITSQSQDQASSKQSSSAASTSSGYSSSAQLAEISAPSGMAALPSAPSPAASAGGQMGQDQGMGGGGWMHALTNNYALEIGGGVNAPTSKKYITWGGQFVLGYGKHITNHLAMLLEYQFINDKIPGAIIAETGAQGGHIHIWSFTLDPLFDLFPSNTNDLYVTGGGGFYRKVTSFTDVVPAQFCSFYYCGIGYTSQTVGHYSSNQGGVNIGGGYLHRFGGLYGPGKMAFFAEARYLNVMSPAVTTQPNGLGTTSVAAGTTLIPVTLGLRW